MERLIRNVTKKFTELLPNDKPFISPDDLRNYDIPEFLVQRIEVEIYRNLNESIVPPHSEWADMSADDVEYAWEQFIDAIVEEVRMPASYTASVFETSVADVIELILQPRTAIPSILFGPETERQKGDLQKMTRFITVNSHLAEAVLKYMDRREKILLNIHTCKQIVEKVDDRLTQNYNPLNWAQLLQPLFILSGPKIDSELFRIFFENRGMHRVSHRFDLIDDSIDKSRFIEILSSPDLIDEESEEDQGPLFDAISANRGPKERKEIDKAEEEIVIKKENSLRKDQSDEIKVNSEPDTDSSDIDAEQEDTLLTTFQSRLRDADDHDDEEVDYSGSLESDKNIYDELHEEEVVEDEDDMPETDNERPLHSRFSSDEERTADEDLDHLEREYERESNNIKLNNDDSREIEFNKELKSKLGASEQEEHSFEDSDETENKPDVAEDNIDESFLFGEKTSDVESSEEVNDRPIWQSFLGEEENIEDDDIEEPQYSAFADFEEDNDSEDDPIMNLIKKAEKDDEDKKVKLIEWLKDDEKRFIRSMFKGSYSAYEQAIIKLDNFDNWKQASSYIGKDIFSKTYVDMYDEDSVDFTDKLQAYFDEYKS